jgi:hypothetical protein
MTARGWRSDARAPVGTFGLRVVYVPDLPPTSVFIITAYDLPAKAKVALRRRRRRK